jgi:SAM-dependent methyltransferase
LKKLIPYKVEEEIHCPVCTNLCSDNVLSAYTVEETAANFCPPTRNKDRYQRLVLNIQNLWNRNESLLVKCNACGFAFGYPHVGGDELFYSILHEQYGYPGWRAEYDIAINQVLKQHACGLILDIGAGTGNFLLALDKTWECYAVEGSEITRTLLKKQAISTYPDLDELIAAKAKSFTIVTLFQVLEHIGDFNSILAKCYSLLKQGGHIVISVPDGNDMIKQEEILHCPDYPPNHINKWTTESLSATLNKHGFKIIKSFKSPDSLQELKSALHVKILGNAAQKPTSLAAKVYSINNKKLRIPLIAMLAVLEAVKLLPHLKQLYKGRSLMIYAEAL